MLDGVIILIPSFSKLLGFSSFSTGGNVKVGPRILCTSPRNLSLLYFYPPDGCPRLSV